MTTLLGPESLLTALALLIALVYPQIGARWFDPAVYERHRPDLSHQRLRIMELSPLYGDGVPRLLAATFNPVK